MMKSIASILYTSCLQNSKLIINMVKT